MDQQYKNMKSYLGPDSASSRAKMSRLERERIAGQPLTQVIVEGETDFRFYKKIIDNRSCVLTFTDGKKKALQTLALLIKEGCKGTICIVDRDFDELLDEYKDACPNIIVSDTHDLETLILKSESLDWYISFLIPTEHAYHTEDLANTIRLKLIELGKPIGNIRWINEKENFRFNFKRIHLEDFITTDQGNIGIDINRLIDVLLSNNRVRLISKGELLNKAKAVDAHGLDPWIICQGHDLICILFRILPGFIESYYSEQTSRFAELLKEKVSSIRIVEDWLINGYDRGCFKKTNMYLMMKAWENTNKPYRVLRED